MRPINFFISGMLLFGPAKTLQQTKPLQLVSNAWGSRKRLSIKRSPYTPPASQVRPGSHHIWMSEFILTAPNSSAVRITSLKIIAEGAYAFQSIKNIRLYDGATRLKLGFVEQLTQGSLHNARISIAQLVLAAGTSKTIRLYADITDYAEGHYRVGVEQLYDEASTIETSPLPIFGNYKIAVKK